MASTVTVQHPEIDRARGTLRAIWLRLGTPLLIVLMALAIALTITRNWTSWEGGRSEQVTNDAYVRREITPLSTKVVGLVREVKVSDYQHVRQGEELVVLADDDYRAQVSQAVAAVDAAKAALENNHRQRELQDSRTQRALAGIEQATAQIAAAAAGKNAVQADVERTRAERARQEALLEVNSATRQHVEAAVADAGTVRRAACQARGGPTQARRSCEATSWRSKPSAAARPSSSRRSCSLSPICTPRKRRSPSRRSTWVTRGSSRQPPARSASDRSARPTGVPGTQVVSFVGEHGMGTGQSPRNPADEHRRR